ncbi:hypothetical protein [Streptomyces sp. NRRL S-37]|uniref:hypothetical protein n=1 Tax=Streptomyces sp. NRRL S-37 TaxID=1463903 RepID=UPI000AF1C063|nr:hypothetical protein [Streptomyces sp. NRRL S-37]
MSEAFAQFLETGVAPGLDFVPPPPPPPPPPPDPNELAHTGPLHMDGTTEEVASQLGELATEAAQQVADVALQTLGTLSGALLAGRAALAATKVLAGAAVRAAEEQRCLERQEKVSADAAEQWRNAAFAAARANARRRALQARIDRAARTAPGDPPPRPDLPGPLDPATGRLGDFRRELDRFDRALEAAERAQEAWEAEALLASLADPADGADGPDWQDALRARQQDLLRARPAEREAPHPVPEPPRTTDPVDAATVRDQGAGILAALDPSADAELVRMASEAVGHAVTHAARPQRSRRHLREARTFVAEANRKAWKLRREVEQAAVQLDFLTMPLPDDPDLPEPDPRAVAALRKCVDDQVPLTSDERDLVERGTAARCAALEALYLKRQCTGVLAGLALDTAGDLRVAHTGDHTVTLDWTPGGWGPDHWLRMELRGENVHVTTMRPATRGERRAEDLELDARRCAEAGERLDEFRALAAKNGLPLTFGMRDGEVLAGTLVEPAARDVRTGPPVHGPRTHPTHRTAPGPGRG